MLCKKPYVRNEHVTKNTPLSTEQARNMATPFGCGQCLPCRINKAREWTHRMLLEATVHDESSFITLTYHDEFLPDPPDVKKSHLQQYLKKLRSYTNGKTFRYYGVGEYGDESWRPHYHIAIFGLGPEDRGNIERAWSENGDSRGFIYFGSITKDSARYISGYCVKKLTRCDDKRLQGRSPEFAISSTREGGIGYGAIRELAESLLKDKNFDASSQAVIRELRYNRKTKLPLGRYLTNKLIEELGLDDDKVKREIMVYQYKLFQEANDGDNYYCTLIDNGSQKREQMRKKQKIFKQRRSL